MRDAWPRFDNLMVPEIQARCNSRNQRRQGHAQMCAGPAQASATAGLRDRWYNRLFIVLKSVQQRP